jgi:hypothetical protein
VRAPELRLQVRTGLDADQGEMLDGTLHFCAGSHEQKAKNLQANPGCMLAAGALTAVVGIISLDVTCAGNRSNAAGSCSAPESRPAAANPA